MVANILPADLPTNPTPATLGVGSVGQNSTFSEHGHVAYQIQKNQKCSSMVANTMPKGLKGIMKCSNTVANILSADLYPSLQTPPPTLGMGSVGQNSTFSEHGHVGYQIKENHKCSNMVANILPTDTLTRPRRCFFK